jgi:DNA-binding NarL/FixJ family response regulator
MTPAEIAKRLKLSEWTVYRHLSATPEATVVALRRDA